MTVKRVVILAGGTIGKKEFYKNFFLSDDYIICANGGLLNAEKLGVKPDLIIGDLDSVKDYSKYSCKIITFPREKDKTDTEIALDFTKNLSPEQVIIIGGLGKRIDHSLGNVYLLLKKLELGYNITLLDEYNQVDLITEKLTITSGLIGETISLIPLTEKVTGITTSGLKYGLNNDNLYIGQTRGISNEIIEIPVNIKLKSGLILIVRNLKNLDKN